MNSINHNHYDTCQDDHFPSRDCGAPNCDDQIPIMAGMSRGLKGNSYKVVVHDDTDNLSAAELADLIKNPETAKNFNFCDETTLEGLSYDEATKTWNSEWLSKNINGGRLHYQYNLRPHSIPQTFTLTFIEKRPGRTEWAFTTPPIPYLWDVDGDGKPDVDGVVGAGVGNLFFRESKTSPWLQTEHHGTKTPVPPHLPSSTGRWGQLNWPEGWEPKDFNGVSPTEAWASTVTFGYGGDVPLPNLDDIAKIIGVTRTVIENILKNVPSALAGSDNVKDYIDDKDKALETKITNYIDQEIKDLRTELKTYIDNEITQLKTYIDNEINTVNKSITNLGAKYDGAMGDITNKVYLGGTFSKTTGRITWPTVDKIAIGNMNLYAGGTTSFIKTAVDGDNDLKAE